jgi:PAS domain-containing protein
VAPLTAPLRLMRFSLGLVVALLLAAVLVVATVDLRRERAIADLRARASERFNRLFQMLPVAVALTRASDGSLVEANDVARRLMGDTGNGNGTLPARALEMWSDPQDAARVRQQLAADGIVSEYSGRFSVGDGKSTSSCRRARSMSRRRRTS